MTRSTPIRNKADDINSNDNIYSLRCETWPIDYYLEKLDNNCTILKLYNRTEVELMPIEQSIDLARFCACQLNSMDLIWENEFDSDPSTRAVWSMVLGKLEYDHRMGQLDHQRHVNLHFSQKQEQTKITPPPRKHPRNNNVTILDMSQPFKPLNDYLWNDVDVTIKGISIYTSTKDYFNKINHPRYRMSSTLKSRIQNDEDWYLIRNVCWKVQVDQRNLYQYLENLARLNPIVFLELVSYNQHIEYIYQASKACKLLLLEHLNDYQLKPSLPDLVAVQDYPIEFEQRVAISQKNEDADDANNIDFDHTKLINNNENNGSASRGNPTQTSGDHDSTTTTNNDAAAADQQIAKHHRNPLEHELESSSPSMITGCKQHKRLEMNALAKQCPMMFDERISSGWFQEHHRAMDRSRIALQCGCQLLLHNSTWSILMQDPNVRLMAKCLTDYLNQFVLPNFKTTPISSLFGWFDEMMEKFSTNRQFTIRRMFESQSPDGDPEKPINHLDDMKSLEILRRGCNLIMFNYNRNSRFTSELKLIKYLDRLQLLSQDHLFVFHLTLMDPNLFKLHALSKMCEPIISN